MDFTPDEETQSVRTLAARIIADQAGISGEEAEGRLHRALGQAGLLGVHLPAGYGGSDLGVTAVAAVLEEQGRASAAAPLWPVYAASYAVARFGPAELRQAWLPGVAAGTPALTVALEEFGPGDPAAPATTVTATAEGWALTGTKAAVPALGERGAVVVSANGAEGPALFLVEAGGPGVTWEPTLSTDTAPTANLVLDGAPGLRLGAADALRETLHVAALGVCATQLGVMQGALRLAADHVSERHQFGRPLATFQAVQHKLADCYIDVEATRVSLWQALSDVTEGSERALTSVPVAQWWAARTGLDVVHRTQHLHGGTGVDLDYPAHRFFLWARQLAGTLGSEHVTLGRLGDLIAAGSAAVQDVAR